MEHLKHSSLLRKPVNYCRKKFYSTGPRTTKGEISFVAEMSLLHPKVLVTKKKLFVTFFDTNDPKLERYLNFLCISLALPSVGFKTQL